MIKKIIRYIGVIAIATLPLGLYIKYVLEVDLSHYSQIEMFGLGMVLVVFSEIMQLRKLKEK